jgi:hypothetical protein
MVLQGKLMFSLLIEYGNRGVEKIAGILGISFDFGLRR